MKTAERLAPVPENFLAPRSTVVRIDLDVLFHRKIVRILLRSGI